LTPAMNVLPSVKIQESSALPDANLISLPMTSNGDSTQKQRSLDAALSNALIPTKNANVPEKATLEVQAPEEGMNVSGGARQLDVILPSMLKQVAGDESAHANLMPNVGKNGVFKEVVMKEALIPVAFQPAAQANTVLAAQQATQQAPSANIINAYPGKAGWDQAISQKVVWMVGAGQQSATLTLNPPDLGPLQVVIHVHNDKADTSFISNNAEVRQALQDGLSNLRDKMSESGLQLGQTSISAGQQSQQQFQQAMQGRQTSQTNNTNAGLPMEKTAESSTLVRVSNGLVDTFA
jgi:flagellar hook-length control protein FliK